MPWLSSSRVKLPKSHAKLPKSRGRLLSSEIVVNASFKSWELGLLKSLLMQLAQFAPHEIAATEDGNPTRKRDTATLPRSRVGSPASGHQRRVTIKLQF